MLFSLPIYLYDLLCIGICSGNKWIYYYILLIVDKRPFKLCSTVNNFDISTDTYSLFWLKNEDDYELSAHTHTVPTYCIINGVLCLYFCFLPLMLNPKEYFRITIGRNGLPCLYFIIRIPLKCSHLCHQSSLYIFDKTQNKLFRILNIPAPEDITSIKCLNLKWKTFERNDLVRFTAVTSRVNKPTAILTRSQFISETNDCNLISQAACDRGNRLNYWSTVSLHHCDLRSLRACL